MKLKICRLSHRYKSLSDRASRLRATRLLQWLHRLFEVSLLQIAENSRGRCECRPAWQPARGWVIFEVVLMQLDGPLGAVFLQVHPRRQRSQSPRELQLHLRTLHSHQANTCNNVPNLLREWGFL